MINTISRNLKLISQFVIINKALFHKHTLLIIPYIQGFSEKIKGIWNKYGVKTAFRTKNNFFSTHKNPKNTNQMSKNAVYSVLCVWRVSNCRNSSNTSIISRENTLTSQNWHTVCDPVERIKMNGTNHLLLRRLTWI